MNDKAINFTHMKQNMGETLRNAIDKEGIIVTHLCKKVWGSPKKTKTLYNWYKKDVIPWEKIEMITKEYPVILKYFPDKHVIEVTDTVLKEQSSVYGQDWKKIAEEWQSKYYSTLGQLTECREKLQRA